MNDDEEDQNVSILLSPDGYEMVIPMFNKKFSCIKSLVGVDTAKTYYEAKVRSGQEISSVQTRLMKMSNWPKIVSWFTIFPDQSERVSLASVNWMVGTAGRVISLGYESESIVGVDIMNAAVEGEINGEDNS